MYQTNFKKKLKESFLGLGQNRVGSLLFALISKKAIYDYLIQSFSYFENSAA